jgi:uncharacterized membrane protein YphA (DoxX/SURF4 family)
MAEPLVPRPAVAVALAIVLVSVAWFVMSHWLMHNPARDAVDESLGVLLGLLIIVSVIGAVRSRSPDDDTPDRE